MKFRLWGNRRAVRPLLGVLRLLPSDVSLEHDALKATIAGGLADAGWEAYVEERVNGLVDIAAYRDGRALGVEIDWASPKMNSIRKLTTVNWASAVILRHDLTMLERVNVRLRETLDARVGAVILLRL